MIAPGTIKTVNKMLKQNRDLKLIARVTHVSLAKVKEMARERRLKEQGVELWSDTMTRQLFIL